jgi:hypothetical protein
MPVVPREQLERLAARALRARALLRGGARTTRGGPMPIRFLSRFRTSDRLGIRPYQRGDPMSQLVWRDLLLRDEVNVRSYRTVSELYVRVALDPRPILLRQKQAGPFAVQLALCLALRGIGGRHRTRLSYFGLAPPSSEASHPRHLYAFVDSLLRLEPTPAPPGFDPAAGLATAWAGQRANVNLFAVLHVGYPAEQLERLLRLLREQVEQATVFLVVEAEDFLPSGAFVADPETGQVVAAPANPVRTLTAYLEAAIALGRRLGVRVEPLLIEDHAADIETVLPMLSGST